MTDSPSATAVKQGRFVLEHEGDSLDFNIRPDPDMSGPIPEEQRKVQETIYATMGTLKYLEASHAFRQTGQFEEFLGRLKHVAEVGIVGQNVHPGVALGAMAQVREEIAIRVGKAIKISYLKVLGLFALLFAALFTCLAGFHELIFVALLNINTKFAGNLIGYFWVIVGSMVGLWLSVAAKRKMVLFEELPDMLGDQFFEPLIRVAFVMLLACVFALFIELQILTIVIGSISLFDFSTSEPDLGNIGVALLLGLIAGVGERALSIRILDQARSALSSDK